MSNKIFFTPGPTQLFHTYQDHFKEALKRDVPSLSHRGKDFMKIFQETCENLKSLLELPDEHHIYFTGSANEIWERIIQNLVIDKSHHFINGAFAQKFYDFAKQYQKSPTSTLAENGQHYHSLDIPEGTDLTGITLNETSNGYMFSPEDIYSLKKSNPECLVAVDGVSVIPSIPMDFQQIDTAFFSVQKCFGMPAGLGVWIANDSCLERAHQLKSDGLITGSYHSLHDLEKYAKKSQTPETPNVLAIYILGKIAEDMLRRGLNFLRNETTYKSTILYTVLDNHPHMKPFISDKKHRSKTVIVINTPSEPLIKACNERGWVLGSGYGDQKTTQVRIANFPMHSKEQVEQLCDFLSNN